MKPVFKARILRHRSCHALADGDLTAARCLADPCSAILKTGTTLDQVLRNSDLQPEPRHIPVMAVIPGLMDSGEKINVFRYIGRGGKLHG